VARDRIYQNIFLSCHITTSFDSDQDWAISTVPTSDHVVGCLPTIHRDLFSALRSSWIFSLLCPMKFEDGVRAITRNHGANKHVGGLTQPTALHDISVTYWTRTLVPSSQSHQTMQSAEFRVQSSYLQHGTVRCSKPFLTAYHRAQS
jgi:hypothetical protein